MKDLQQDVEVDIKPTTHGGDQYVLKKTVGVKTEWVQASRRRNLGIRVRLGWTKNSQDAESWGSPSAVRDFASRHNLRIVNEDVLER